MAHFQRGDSERAVQLLGGGQATRIRWLREGVVFEE
ncbi:MAG: hypothetical protein QG573_1519, partial [Acidobacteriota bacterium]|nr:hypothetical protein [Acidobacteriota bacterium]